MDGMHDFVIESRGAPPSGLRLPWRPRAEVQVEVCSVLCLLLGLGDVLLDAVHPSKLLSARSRTDK